MVLLFHQRVLGRCDNQHTILVYRTHLGEFRIRRQLEAPAAAVMDALGKVTVAAAFLVPCSFLRIQPAGRLESPAGSRPRVCREVRRQFRRLHRLLRHLRSAKGTGPRARRNAAPDSGNATISHEHAAPVQLIAPWRCSFQLGWTDSSAANPHAGPAAGTFRLPCETGRSAPISGKRKRYCAHRFSGPKLPLNPAPDRSTSLDFRCRSRCGYGIPIPPS